MRYLMVMLALTVALVGELGLAAAADTPAGFTVLFNGKDFSGWKVPVGDNGHWKIIDGGVIDYDAKSEAKKDKNLWTEKSYKNFILQLDWRLKTDPGFKNKVPVILPDGTHKKDESGKEIRLDIEDVDSGIFLRGFPQSQVNIWMWPAGSGEVYGYRTSKKVSPEVRAAVTPKKKADKPRGEWNTFEIKLVDDRLWVKLNGEEVISNAQLPGLPSSGPIGLQHHGSWNNKTNQWNGPPSLIQFRNIMIKEQ